MLQLREKGSMRTVVVQMVVAFFMILISLAVGFDAINFVGTSSAQESDIENVVEVIEAAENKCDASSSGGVSTTTEVIQTFGSLNTLEYDGDGTFLGDFEDGSSDSWNLAEGCDYSFSASPSGSNSQLLDTSEGETWRFLISSPNQGEVEIEAQLQGDPNTAS